MIWYTGTRKRFDRYHELGQAACVWRKAGSLDHVASAADLWGQCGHRVYGHRRKISPKSLQHILQRLQVNQPHQVYSQLCFWPFRTLPPPEIQLHLRRLVAIMFLRHLFHGETEKKRINISSKLNVYFCVCSYSTKPRTASVHKGVHKDVSYDTRASTDIGAVFNFFSALGDVAFAYAGHNVRLEIQATIPSTQGQPSKGPMWRVSLPI